MLTPKPGDTVLVEMVVHSLRKGGYYDGFFFVTKNGDRSENSLDLVRIKEVIPAPWEPKVGDKCRLSRTAGIDATIFEILGIYGEQVWVGWGTDRSSVSTLKAIERDYVHVDA